jgi:hypothetical protein
MPLVHDKPSRFQTKINLGAFVDHVRSWRPKQRRSASAAGDKSMRMFFFLLLLRRGPVARVADSQDSGKAFIIIKLGSFRPGFSL